MDWYGSIDETWDLNHCILNDPGLSLGSLIPGTGPSFVISDLGREYMGQFTYDGVNILVRLGYTVDAPPCQERSGGKCDLHHGILGVFVLLVYGVHAVIYG